MRKLWTALSIAGVAATILTGSGAWDQIAHEIVAAVLGGAAVAFWRRRPHVDYLALRKLCEELEVPWSSPSMGWMHREMRKAMRRDPLRRVGSWFRKNGSDLAFFVGVAHRPQLHRQRV